MKNEIILTSLQSLEKKRAPRAKLRNKIDIKQSTYARTNSIQRTLEAVHDGLAKTSRTHGENWRWSNNAIKEECAIQTSISQFTADFRHFVEMTVEKQRN